MSLENLPSQRNSSCLQDKCHHFYWETQDVLLNPYGSGEEVHLLFFELIYVNHTCWHVVCEIL